MAGVEPSKGNRLGSIVVWNGLCVQCNDVRHIITVLNLIQHMEKNNFNFMFSW